MSATSTTIAAVVGDHVPGHLHTMFERSSGKIPKPGKHVGPRCAERAGVGFWCLSCRVFLANAGQRDTHVETGRHVIAHACEIHGAEAMP